MATYAYRSISERQKIQSLWESGASVKEIAQDFDLSVSAIYTELKRGYDGTRLPAMMRNWHSSLSKNLLNGGAAKLPRHNRPH